MKLIEIYPQKATNSMVLDKILLELQKEYDLVKVFDGGQEHIKGR